MMRYYVTSDLQVAMWLLPSDVYGGAPSESDTENGGGRGAGWGGEGGGGANHDLKQNKECPQNT